MKNLGWVTGMLIGALAVPAGFAQVQPDAYEAARTKVTQMRKTVKREERELGFMDEKLIRLDSRVEQRVNDLVERVTEAKDSVATDGRMDPVKEQVIAGLRLIIDLYVKEREKHRNQGWSTENLDGRIDLRLEQMTRLAATLSPAEAVAEPLRASNEGFDYNMEETVAAVKAGKPTGHMVTNRKELQRELEAVVGFLSERQKWAEMQLEVTTDEQEKAALQKKIADQSEILAKRRAQLEEVKTAPEPENTKLVGVQAVSALEKELFRVKEPLRADYRELLEVKSQRDYQRKKVEYLRKELAQVEAAFEKQAAPGK